MAFALVLLYIFVRCAWINSASGLHLVNYRRDRQAKSKVELDKAVITYTARFETLPEGQMFKEVNNWRLEHPNVQEASKYNKSLMYTLAILIFYVCPYFPLRLQS